MQNILILGTGKMARNIGLFFLRQDCSVSWVSRNSGRADSFRNQLVKDIRRLSLVLDKQTDDLNGHVYEISNIPQKEYDLILESINEDLGQKQDIISTIQSLLKNDTILASNSSSILPYQIHKSAIGLHFFYPVELTGLLEIIKNPDLEDDQIFELINQFKSWGVNTIIQNEHNAFAVNRLLLPMQVEAFRILQEGYPAELVNECSKTDQIKIGQLEMMDSIGFDVLLPAIKNYVSRIPDDEQKEYKILISGLDLLIKNDKLGKKNKNGLLMGEPLPWNETRGVSDKFEDLFEKFSQIFNETGIDFVKNKQITQNELHLVLQNLFN